MSENEKDQESEASKQKAKPVAPATKQRLPEKFYRVRFHVKRDANDTDEVMLAVQGRPLTIERDKPVIISERYKCCADNAKFPVYRQLPNEPRKTVGEVRVYPYDLLGDATEAEYLAQLKPAPKAA